MGTRKLAIEDVTLSYVSSGNATIAFPGSTNIPLYYGSLSNTASIDTLVSSLNGYTVDIIGYLNCFESGSTKKMQCLVRSTNDIIAEGVTYSLFLDNNNYTGIDAYETGNYGTESVDGFTFEHYRANKPDYSSDDFVVLLPFASHYNDGSAAGALYNTDSISGIESVAITYRTETLFGQKPIVSTGQDISTVNNTYLNLSTSNVTTTINVENTNFFKVSTNENILYIVNISIEYSNNGPSDSFTYLSSGLNSYRINPILNSGALYEGKSVTVPTSVSRSGSYYTVTSTKTYTYYSFAYVQSYPYLADGASYTDPLDVAAFYTTFGTHPANYVLKGSYSSAYTIFGNDARCYSEYSRTDGYATAVPYQADTSGYPLYHELDIALSSSYSSNNRGVGRVVAWQYGFDESKGATNYDDAPVCVYTDDHYATFIEYLNAGSFGTRFNSEMLRTPYIWGAPQTLILA